ncbi:stress-induced protein, KGG, repeat-containing protein [Terrilactibacillus sp. BCM23-1]|uniref:Stress-induced protein, KGG, repeat-containing protein n=1 Tax=Terrilactibacillus tamarindi TaxID=2599694 RepID=A0A6N8CQA4_9BACI|nr:stress-induced protein, KGG, repeat-containing protein [Terrilactibacillus tamarindi]
MAKDNDHKMSREEAGHKGGETTSKKHGKEFYQEIGEKGGEATSKNHDKEYYQEIGHKGGSN